ncbi:MAG: anthranilate phosphoribosyltransferase [Acidobacteriaceae bacterium]|nr:anthranilate phosphoribosyltransferase [Acidobacteriaceae bacterium]
MSFPGYLKLVVEARSRLTREQACELMRQILERRLSEIEIAALIGAISARGETPEEIAGFVDAMRQAVTHIPVTWNEQTLLVDTCGTGGDYSKSFNISTASGLVAAAAGASVAKHGNRAITSQCGSADVLEALGIPIHPSPAEASESLRLHRFAFLNAAELHPAMKAVMPVRKALPVRTFFNLLGPLTNPAGATAQVMGVYSPPAVRLVADSMVLLGMRHAYVVYGRVDPHLSGRPDAAKGAVAGLDEISISGATWVAEIRHGKVREFVIAPEDVGMTRSPVESIMGGDARQNAGILRDIFAGKPGPHRDIVLLNSAAVLAAAGLAPDLPAGVRLAARTIDSGAVTKLVATLSGKG